MGMEEEVFGAFKYTGFMSGNKKIDPTVMVRTLLNRLEVSMLAQMQAKIKARISELQGNNEPQQEDEGSMDPFAILGVDMNATREEVDKAYKEKAHSVHPDVGGSNIEMAKLNAAYETIRIFKGWKEK